MRLTSWVTRAWWGTALTCALLLCAPLAFFFGHAVPDWMSDVFVVAGVPVTLVVSILVFLLANVAGQELRTASSFRAVISRTFLVWPIALAVVFLAWCAAIEIFGSVDGAPPPRFATAWAFVVFTAQLALVLLVATRIFTTVAPDSVAATVRSAFAEEVRRVVRDRERGRVALQLFEDACGEAGVARRYYGSSAGPVGFPRAGSITDIDLRLPARLADLTASASVSVGLRLGFDARPDAAVAWIDTTDTTEAARAVAHGVSISRRRRGRHTVEQLFDEVLDLSRRAVAGGGAGPIDSTFDLIADCLSEMPAAYQLYGLDFTEQQVRSSSILGDDYTLTRPLSRFAADVTASGNEHARAALPTLGLKFSRHAREIGAPLLLQYAVDLWLQLLSAARIQNSALHRRYLTDLGPFAGMVIRSITADASNELRPLAQREQDASLLRRLFGFQAELLKAAIDTGDAELFQAMWEDWGTWARGWQPDEELDDAQLAEVTAAEDQRPAARTRLDLARAGSRMKADLADYREWIVFNLGVWALARFEQDKLLPDTWRILLAYLSDPFADDADAAAIISQLDTGARLVRDWDMNAQLAAASPGKGAWGQAEPITLRWLALILLRETPSSSGPWEIEISGTDSQVTVNQLLHTLRGLSDNPGTWEPVVGGALSARINTLRHALQTGSANAATAALEQLADAPLDAESVQSFVSAQQRTFLLANRIRDLIRDADNLQIEQPETSTTELGVGELLDKRLFTGEDDDPSPLHWGDIGRELAMEQQQAIYDRLVALSPAQPAPDGPAKAVRDAVDQLRHHDHAPDAILVPKSGAARAFVRSQPGFIPRPPSREHPAEVGELHGLPVLAVGPVSADQIVVGRVGAAMRLDERTRGETTSSLYCEVRPISTARAQELAAHFTALGHPPTPEDVRAFHQQHVELFAHLDGVLRDVSHADAYVCSIALPGQSSPAG